MQPLEPDAPAARPPRTSVALLEPIMPEPNREEFAERHDTDFAYEIPGLARFRANVFVDRKGRGAVFRVIPAKILTRRRARPLAAHPQAVPAEQGAGARHRPDRLGQVDDALRDDRLHQPHAQRPHHHDRGSDRVRAREQEVPDQPARGRARTPTRSRTRCARRCARIRTSSWSASCATSRRSRSRSRRRRPATWCSARCTRRRRRRRSIASSTSSRPTGRRRSASCCRSRCKGVIAQNAVPQDRRRPRRGARGADRQRRRQQPDSRGARPSRSRRSCRSAARRAWSR